MHACACVHASNCTGVTTKSIGAKFLGQQYNNSSTDENPPQLLKLSLLLAAATFSRVKIFIRRKQDAIFFYLVGVEKLCLMEMAHIQKSTCMVHVYYFEL